MPKRDLAGGEIPTFFWRWKDIIRRRLRFRDCRRIPEKGDSAWTEN